MLADAVEAAGRTLTDPTPARIRGMVQKIINNIFIDGQLDECELTLKDLHRIANSFEKILGGIFHHRVDYPEPVYKENVKEKTSEKKNGNGKKSSTDKKKSDDPNREQAKEPSDNGSDTGEGSPADLKRLGMS